MGYIMCVKRTNLVLNEHLLEDAVKLSGERTYSAAVARALEDFLRRVRANRILELAGSGLWEGTSPRCVTIAGHGPLGDRRVVLVDTSVWVEVFAGPVV